MYELTIEKIAAYTRRSLATFKRNFKKVSDLSPLKWIIRKRLEKAHELIHEKGRKITEVCYDVGFKNRSHFRLLSRSSTGMRRVRMRLYQTINENRAMRINHMALSVSLE